MKRFVTVFCSIIMLTSATAAYAGTMTGWKIDPIKHKYVWVGLNTAQQIVNTTEATTKQPATITTEKTTEETSSIKTTNTTQNNSQSEISMATQVLNLVNKERAKQNLAPLKLNAELTKIAQLKSEDMRNKNYFDHTSPTYGSPFQMMSQFGISYKYAGENIAKGQKTAEAVVNAWMNSEGHRKNILNKNFTDMGLGYIKSGSITYWTQMFIKK